MKKIILSVSSLFLLSSTAFAEGAAPQQGNPLVTIGMLVLFFAVFWFVLMRPQQKKNKELREMLSQLAKGDEVLTSGGMMGKIAKIGDTVVDLEVAENTTIKIQRASVAKVLPKGSIKA